MLSISRIAAAMSRSPLTFLRCASTSCVRFSHFSSTTSLHDLVDIETLIYVCVIVIPVQRNHSHVGPYQTATTTLYCVLLRLLFSSIEMILLGEHRTRNRTKTLDLVGIVFSLNSTLSAANGWSSPPLGIKLWMSKVGGPSDPWTRDQHLLDSSLAYQLVDRRQACSRWQIRAVRSARP